MSVAVVIGQPRQGLPGIVIRGINDEFRSPEDKLESRFHEKTQQEFFAGVSEADADDPLVLQQLNLRTLQALAQQLAQLSQHATSLFLEVHNDVSETGRRIKGVQEHVGKLSECLPYVRSKFETEKHPLSMYDNPSGVVPWQTEMEEGMQLFTDLDRDAPAISALWNGAQSIPDLKAIEHVSVPAKGESELPLEQRRGFVRYYTNPEFFMEEWVKQFLQETEQVMEKKAAKKKKRKERKAKREQERRKGKTKEVKIKADVGRQSMTGGVLTDETAKIFFATVKVETYVDKYSAFYSLADSHYAPGETSLADMLEVLGLHDTGFDVHAMSAVEQHAMDIFREYDADNSNSIDKQEFRELLRAMDAQPEDIGQSDVYFEAIDDDDSGHIDAYEFAHWWAAAHATMEDQQVTPGGRHSVGGEGEDGFVPPPPMEFHSPIPPPPMSAHPDHGPMVPPPPMLGVHTSPLGQTTLSAGLSSSSMLLPTVSTLNGTGIDAMLPPPPPMAMHHEMGGFPPPPPAMGSAAGMGMGMPSLPEHGAMPPPPPSFDLPLPPMQDMGGLPPLPGEPPLLFLLHVVYLVLVGLPVLTARSPPLSAPLRIRFRCARVLRRYVPRRYVPPSSQLHHHRCHCR